MAHNILRAVSLKVKTRVLPIFCPKNVVKTREIACLAQYQYQTFFVPQMSVKRVFLFLNKWPAIVFNHLNVFLLDINRYVIRIVTRKNGRKQMKTCAVYFHLYGRMSS